MNSIADKPEISFCKSLILSANKLLNYKKIMLLQSNTQVMDEICSFGPSLVTRPSNSVNKGVTLDSRPARSRR